MGSEQEDAVITDRDTNLASARGVWAAVKTDVHLGVAAKSYGYEARTVCGDAFEHSFEWARGRLDDEKVLGPTGEEKELFFSAILPGVCVECGTNAMIDTAQNQCGECRLPGPPVIHGVPLIGVNKDNCLGCKGESSFHQCGEQPCGACANPTEASGYCHVCGEKWGACAEAAALEGLAARLNEASEVIYKATKRGDRNWLGCGTHGLTANQWRAGAREGCKTCAAILRALDDLLPGTEPPAGYGGPLTSSCVEGRHDECTLGCGCACHSTEAAPLDAPVHTSAKGEATVIRALTTAYSFFEHRDRMNAAVHDMKPRWSPLTLMVRDALKLLGKEGPNA